MAHPPSSTTRPRKTWRLLNLSSLVVIRRRENDWRDAWDHPQIIWSPESRHHRDFGRNAAGHVDKSRTAPSSKIFSFAILGGVIGFVLYTYFTHVLMTRRLERQREQKHLEALIHCSALLMTQAGHQQAQLMAQERRRSLINMFRGFRL